MSKEENPWQPRGNDESEALVNDRHLVVFPMPQGAGWCVAIDGCIVKSKDRSRLLLPSKKHAQDHAIAAVQEDHTS